MSKLISDTKRLVRLEQLILRGVTNQYELAAAFGVGIHEIFAMMKHIREQWLANDVEDVKQQVLKREKQLEALAQKALTAYDRSKQDVEEFTVVERVCTRCKGDGQTEEKPDYWVDCTECQGKGRITTETTKVKGQPGDPSFLKVAKECFVECARLKGLYPTTNTMQMKRLVSESREVGGEIQTRVEEMYLEASDDKIIKALQALDVLQREIKGEKVKSGSGHLRQEIIDVSPPRSNAPGAEDVDSETE